MVKDWSDRQIDVYFAGIDSSDYPAIFWERMKPWLRGCSSILDIGCGPGAFTLKALDEGFYVQAVDINEKNLQALETRIKKKGYPQKCTLLRGDWLENPERRMPV